MSDAPCTASEAVARAKSMINNGGQYLLGTGDYQPVYSPGMACKCCGTVLPGKLTDVPWTRDAGSDCAGFAICYCWKITRHRPGFAKGFPRSLDIRQDDIDDDVNCNSLIEDAVGARSLCADITGIAHLSPGDLLVYPSFHLGPTPFIGHVGIVLTDSPPDYKPGEYAKVQVAQCHGPDGFKPGVVQTDGSLWQHHDTVWPTLGHVRVIAMHNRS